MERVRSTYLVEVASQPNACLLAECVLCHSWMLAWPVVRGAKKKRSVPFIKNISANPAAALLLLNLIFFDPFFYLPSPPSPLFFSLPLLGSPTITILSRLVPPLRTERIH